MKSAGNKSNKRCVEPLESTAHFRGIKTSKWTDHTLVLGWKIQCCKYASSLQTDLKIHHNLNKKTQDVVCGGWGSEGEIDRLIPKPDGKERVCEPIPCCWWDSSLFLCGWSCWDVVWRGEMLSSLVSAGAGALVSCPSTMGPFGSLILLFLEKTDCTSVFLCVLFCFWVAQFPKYTVPQPRNSI